MKIVAEHLTATYHYAIIYDRKAVDNMKKDDDGKRRPPVHVDRRSSLYNMEDFFAGNRSPDYAFFSFA